MPYYRRYRRSVRGRSRLVPGTQRSVRRGPGHDIPRFSLTTGACRKAVHQHPVGLGTFSELRFGNQDPVITAIGSPNLRNAMILNDISEGTGQDNRIGSRIHMRYLFLKIAVTGGDADQVYRGPARIMVVLTPQSHGGPARTADILETWNPQAFRPMDAIVTQRVLYDVTWNMIPTYTANSGGTQSPAYSSSTQRWIQVRIPVNAVATYQSSTGAASNIEAGQLWLFTILGVPGTATTPRAIVSHKLTFEDT